MEKGNSTFEGILYKPLSMLADRIVCDNYLSKQEEYSEKEREQRINEYLSLHCEIEKCLYLTGATMLKCTKAWVGWDDFKIEGHDVYIDGLPAAASTDCTIGEHIEPFPFCAGQSSEEVGLIPCEPKIAYNKWLESCSKMKVGNAESINENSYLICMRVEGGRIYPIVGNGIMDEGPGVEEEIQELMDQIKGEEIESYRYEDLLQLPTVEILARMIYQEDHQFRNGRQNAIAFVVVNRLCHGGYLKTDKTGDKKVNNIYGVITSGDYSEKDEGQFKSIYLNENQKRATDKGNHNAYWPPIEDTADPAEKEAWENAKRLAAIFYLAVEKYGEGEENEKGRCVKVNDEDVREEIINFIEEQVDIQGEPIQNKIGTFACFGSYESLEGDKILEKAVIPEEGAGNVFFEKWE